MGIWLIVYTLIKLSKIGLTTKGLLMFRLLHLIRHIELFTDDCRGLVGRFNHSLLNGNTVNSLLLSPHYPYHTFVFPALGQNNLLINKTITIPISGKKVSDASTATQPARYASKQFNAYSMERSRQLVIRNLKTIEKKHEFFFIVNKLNILDCVEIKGLTDISVHVINTDLPFDIVFDIDTVFWK